MNIHALEAIKPVLEGVLIVGAIGFSALRRNGRKGARELAAPSATRFWLNRCSLTASVLLSDGLPRGSSYGAKLVGANHSDARSIPLYL
ncbi:MAG: hypothetical protein JNL16_12975 [Dechloromonas sp.]|nr:hypothetical protein [Dechloromonas sp.]